MKNKYLLWLGLGAGVVAVATFILGWLVYWPDDSRDGYGSYVFGPEGMAGMMGGSGSSYGGSPVPFVTPGDIAGGMMGGSGMMGAAGVWGPPGAITGGSGDLFNSPLTLDQARDAAGRYLDSWGNSDLKATEVIEFANDFYVRVNEQSTSAGAVELTVGRNTGLATPVPGPSFIWNTKYGIQGSANGSTGSIAGPGMMGPYGSGPGTGMMGGSSRQSRTSVTTDMPVKRDDTQSRAQKFLDREFPGTKAGQPVAFYGYYTVQVEKDGKPFGLLSIEGYYGQIWYQSEHGPNLSTKQY